MTSVSTGKSTGTRHTVAYLHFHVSKLAFKYSVSKSCALFSVDSIANDGVL